MDESSVVDRCRCRPASGGSRARATGCAASSRAIESHAGLVKERPTDSAMGPA
jgi:hypothetical protein